MNRTTVKRGIGAVILALIAAALLAFLLKDKAAQRQEVVEIALPGGTDGSAEMSDQATRLPTLTTDNSGNGSVIANAGSGNGAQGASGASSMNANTGSAIVSSGSGSSNSGSSNSDGTIVASAAAVGAAGAAAVAGAASTATGAVGDTAKKIDFSVKPKIPKPASSEFLDLDLVNNGQAKANTSSASAAASTATTAATTQETATPKSAANTGDGIVIASTSAKSGGVRANTPQPRLIGEKRSAPVKSSRTATVSSRKTTAKSGNKSSASEATSGTAKNGYAIQLLATSSQTRANNLKNVMAQEGYPTHVTKTIQNGKTLYRVRIGQYANKSQAVKAQAAMKRRYKKNTNVNRSAVVAR